MNTLFVRTFVLQVLCVALASQSVAQSARWVTFNRVPLVASAVTGKALAKTTLGSGETVFEECKVINADMVSREKLKGSLNSIYAQCTPFTEMMNFANEAEATEFDQVLQTELNLALAKRTAEANSEASSQELKTVFLDASAVLVAVITSGIVGALMYQNWGRYARIQKGAGFALIAMFILTTGADVYFRHTTTPVQDGVTQEFGVSIEAAVARSESLRSHGVTGSMLQQVLKDAVARTARIIFVKYRLA